jgi:hypothetical protein
MARPFARERAALEDEMAAVAEERASFVAAKSWSANARYAQLGQFVIAPIVAAFAGAMAGKTHFAADKAGYEKQQKQQKSGYDSQGRPERACFTEDTAGC